MRSAAVHHDGWHAGLVSGEPESCVADEEEELGDGGAEGASTRAGGEQAATSLTPMLMECTFAFFKVCNLKVHM